MLVTHIEITTHFPHETEWVSECGPPATELFFFTPPRNRTPLILAFIASHGMQRFIRIFSVLDLKWNGYFISVPLMALNAETFQDSAEKSFRLYIEANDSDNWSIWRCLLSKEFSKTCLSTDFFCWDQKVQTAHLVLYFIFRKAHDITSELLLGTLGFVNR